MLHERFSTLKTNLYIFFNRVASKFGIKMWRGISARTFYLDWMLTENTCVLLACAFMCFPCYFRILVNSSDGEVMIRNN